ncbi:MAG TPA: DNA polymerase III subunit delta [Rickettsiales bacterium]|nr:DNA polymerase III subunit delta [Rickettsiales bacterium]
MKIQSNKIDEFIKTFDSSLRGVVIYGPDTGLISIRKNEILQKVLPDYKNSLSLITLSHSTIKEKPNVLSDEYQSSSLFSTDKKVILIEDAENSVSKLLEEIFSKPQNTENFIIITSDDLDSKSTLKKFADYNQYFAGIPCYKDDSNTIIQIVNVKLRENGFKYNSDVVKYLVESFGGDRLVILSELEKLIIYKDNDKNLTLEDVKACIQDNSEADLNDFVNGFASLNFDMAFKELQNLYSEGVFLVMIVRTAINYFMKLQLYKYQLQNGISFEQLATKENIFWKQKPILAQHLHKLSMNDIDSVLFILLNEECKLKGKII